ncbi:hypothetical protein A2U01_0098596, partial [Trifolium medium]|nr:hypothetical protein [Trifolium medium]
WVCSAGRGRGRNDEVGFLLPPMLDEGSLRPADGLLPDKGGGYVSRGANWFKKASGLCR